MITDPVPGPARESWLFVARRCLEPGAVARPTGEIDVGVELATVTVVGPAVVLVENLAAVCGDDLGRAVEFKDDGDRADQS